MAYVPDNLQKLAGAGPTARQVYTLSGVDAIATVRGAGFISDAGAGTPGGLGKGMRVGDILIYVDTVTPLVSLSRVSAISATGGATLTA